MIDSLVLTGRLILGLASLELTGYALLTLVSRPDCGWRPPLRLSLAFGLGALLVTWWMLFLTFWGWPYSLANLTLPWLPLLVLGLWRAGRRGWLAAEGRFLWQGLRFWLTGRGPAAGDRLVQLGCWLLLLLWVWAVLRAVVYPLWEWDALSTWGLKAKAFYLSRSLDLSRFEAHNYYPNLVPLLLAYLYFWLGEVIDSGVKLVCPVWGLALMGLFYGWLRRQGASVRWALGATLFLVTNGVTLLTHFFLAYADLPLAYFQLAAAGLLFDRLQARPLAGTGLLLGLIAGGMAWSKYEGWPLALILFLAAALGLLWLRPPQWGRRLLALGLILAAAFLLTCPWRLFLAQHGIVAGTDHLGSFSGRQLGLGLLRLLQALVWPSYFGLWWPVLLLAYLFCGRQLWTTPLLFLVLQTLGNLAAVALAYALVPASPAEFPLYIRATMDRLLLHFVPASGLLYGWFWRLVGEKN